MIDLEIFLYMLSLKIYLFIFFNLRVFVGKPEKERSLPVVLKQI